MKRFAFAAAVAAGIGFAQAQTTTIEQPETFGLDQITAFKTQELLLPANAGEPFRAMVDLGGQMVLLDLAPHSVRSANFTIMINDEAGRHEMVNVPAPATYRGGDVDVPGLNEQLEEARRNASELLARWEELEARREATSS